MAHFNKNLAGFKSLKYLLDLSIFDLVPGAQPLAAHTNWGSGLLEVAEPHIFHSRQSLGVSGTKSKNWWNTNRRNTCLTHRSVPDSLHIKQLTPVVFRTQKFSDARWRCYQHHHPANPSNWSKQLVSCEHFTATLILVAGWLTFWGLSSLSSRGETPTKENAPMTFSNQAPQVPPSLPADFSSSLPPGSSIRHILLGHPSHIRQTIHLLHNLRYVETSQWSPLIEVPDNRLILRPEPDDVISMLVRRV